MDHSVVSVLGAPDGGCSHECAVGGADPNNPGNAQGGHIKAPGGELGQFSASGTLAVPDDQKSRGHTDFAPGGPIGPGTTSGNFDEIPSSKGRCTGTFSDSCS